MTAALSGGRRGSGGVRLYGAGTNPKITSWTLPAHGGQTIEFVLEGRTRTAWRRLGKTLASANGKGVASIQKRDLSPGTYRIRVRSYSYPGIQTNRTPWMTFRMTG